MGFNSVKYSQFQMISTLWNWPFAQ